MNFKDLREQLTDESIKNILAQFNVEPVLEDEKKIIFPTCCHNLDGGSPKLYYYKDNKLFHCYTECNGAFDVFTLLQKMYRLRGQEITLRQAVEVCDLDASEITPEDLQMRVDDDIRYMQELNARHLEPLKIRTYDKKILNQFSFDYMGLMPWMQEGIGIEAMQKFNIRYDAAKQAIIIPNFDYNGQLIGIRARYFRPQDIQKGKYRPVLHNGILYAHPTGRTFYGVWENHPNIERKHTAVIFEGEKSVLLYGTIYGNDNNLALATLGQNLTKDHIQALLKMNVRNVILAYDSDYEDYNQLQVVEDKYRAKAKILEPYFNVSYLMDWDFDLPYKSSPIDGGRETFEKLLRNRRII